MTTARKQRTLAKLGAVCTQIEQLLAGQEVTLLELKLPQDAEPGETQLEKLQRFKALLSETLSGLNAGVARSCRACGAPISDVALDEMPWAWRCGAC